MYKASNMQEDEDYITGSYGKLPSVEKEQKVAYPDQLTSLASMRAPTGHLRNMSSYERSSENVELPNIKSAQRMSIAQEDLEKKLK